MKLNKIMEGSIKPWKFETENIQMDQKGKIQFLHPELRGPAQCPFWKTLKTKIAANLKEGLDDVKVPKSFAIEVGKEYKVPLDPTYTTPVCIGAKICAHFRGVSKGAINCDFKLGVKAGPKKKVDVASTGEAVPTVNKAEAPTEKAPEYAGMLELGGGIEEKQVKEVSGSSGFKFRIKGLTTLPTIKQQYAAIIDKDGWVKRELSVGDTSQNIIRKFIFSIAKNPEIKDIYVSPIKANIKTQTALFYHQLMNNKDMMIEEIPLQEEVKKEIVKGKIGIILNNDKFGRDYRIFDFEKALKGDYQLLSQQGYASIKDAKNDAKLMGIAIKSIGEEAEERGSVPAISERTKQTSATPTPGLTDGMPENYPENENKA